MAHLFRSGPHVARQSAHLVARRDAAETALAGPVSVILHFGPRAGVSLAVLLGFLWLLSDRIARIDGQELANAVWQLTPAQWLQAAGFTLLSFWAVGRYDAVLHRHLGTGMPARLARRAGIAAIAVSQTLGLGLVSGAILRWRMLPGVTLWQATRLTAAVALSFLAGWAFVTSICLLILPPAPFKIWAAPCLAALLGVAALSVIGPRAARMPFRWPNAFVLSSLAGLCAIDTIGAALAFHALLPAGSGLAFGMLLPAFLLALGAGLLLGTPGGMGAFEVTLLALLPVSQEPQLLVAILAWRIVYYVLPALAGAALAILGPTPGAGMPRLNAPFPSGADVEALPAETGLRHQGALALCSVGGLGWLVGRRGHVLVALLDPRPLLGPHSVCGPWAIDTALRGLRRLACDEGRIFAAYKTGPRIAARARALGFSARRVGWEAAIALPDYRLSSACRSGLRRKLRQAEAAGVTVSLASHDAAPWPALDALAADWARSHKGERGFSMGRHDRTYLSHQRLYIAWLGDRPIAYASFHHSEAEWTLDLMRHGSVLPDGTMHRLIQQAIEDASAQGVARLSLAAVPDNAFGPRDLAGRLIAALAPETAATGLMRFKAAFAPRWTPLYLIAPGRLSLALAGLSLWRAITRPPLPRGQSLRQIEQDHADYGFASAPGPWHIAERTD